METMIMKQSDGQHVHSWANRVSSASLRNKFSSRPKSTPPSLRSGSQFDYNKYARPKTALASTQRTECGRVYQVEHEPTRKHNLESHLPVKRPRPPPWQKHLDGPAVTCVTAPGYLLSRSKSKMYMYIKTDEFFKEDDDGSSVKKPDPERDALIAQLQQQIDDLTLHLEEERLNHKETRNKAAEELETRMQELTDEWEGAIKNFKEQNSLEMERTRLRHQREINEQQASMDTNVGKLQVEVEFLKGAFESYKSQLHSDTNERWQKKEAEINAQHDEEMQKQIQELRTRLCAEKSMEKTELMKEHQRELHQLKKDSKKEIDALNRRYSNIVSDQKKMKELETKIETAEKEYEELVAEYNDVCTQVTDLTRNLTETKIQLMSFEQNFQNKVEAVEEKYRSQIHELMTQNTELRRLYMKKCGQLYDEKANSESTRIDQMNTAKDAMRLVISTRNRAAVSIAAADPDLADRTRTAKERPSSAPITKREGEVAELSAGETEAYVRKKEQRPSTCKPRILEMIEREREEGANEEGSLGKTEKDHNRPT